jgi:branched-chain amino acid transport system ATP-binding protein
MTEARRSHAAMLEARDLTLKFGGVTALSEISVDIGHQELVALIGPNGAGKSSLLNVLSGFYRPSTGIVRFEGQDIGRWPVHRVAQAAWRAPSRARTCCRT